MKKIDSIRDLVEAFGKKQHMSHEYSKLILKAQASLKEYVLNGICTYCEKKVDRKLLKNKHFMHQGSKTRKIEKIRLPGGAKS